MAWRWRHSMTETHSHSTCHAGHSHATSTPHEAPPGAIWVCPMHPQIRRDGPGHCPICGMALEPEAPSLDDAPHTALIDFPRRFWVAAVLSVPLLAIAMLAEMLGLQF